MTVKKRKHSKSYLLKSYNPKGFTLMELLVSIAIFAIVSVLMSNIVLNIAAFSLDNERRTDFLADLDGAANTIKNDLRAAKEVGLCDIASVKYVYFLNANDPNALNSSHYYILTKDTPTSGQSSRLVWKNVTYSLGQCTYTNAPPIQITTPESMNITSILVTRSCEDRTCVAPKNNLLFLLIESCDAISPTTQKRPIFHCTNNPYTYELAISTRNAQ